MAVGAQKIFLLPVPLAGSSSVDAFLPIPEFRPMTLTAEFVGFLETDQLSARAVEHVAVVGVVAIHAPAVFLVVFENDVIMEFFQFPAFEIDFHVFVTHGAGIIVFT